MDGKNMDGIKIVADQMVDPIGVIKTFHSGEGMTWPVDWMELNIDAGNHREDAIQELVEMLEDHDIIAPIVDQTYITAVENYLDDNGITADHWDVLYGRKHKEIDFVKRLHQDGGGFKVHIDVAHAEAIGVGYGDLVHITIKPS